MAEIWLATNGGHEHIDAVLASGSVPVDRLMVGKEMSAAQVAAIAAQRPTLLHVSEGVIWPRGRRWAAQQARLVHRVKAP